VGCVHGVLNRFVVLMMNGRDDSSNLNAVHEQVGRLHSLKALTTSPTSHLPASSNQQG